MPVGHSRRLRQVDRAARPDQSGRPDTLTVAGKNTITLKNVLVGEVWVCSGQSNMQMTVSRLQRTPRTRSRRPSIPQIRLITVPHGGTQEPQDDFKGQWDECSPETVGGFSAAGYFFGRELYKNLNVPIGLIHCSWGGSSCEAWVEAVVLEADPQYKPMMERWDASVPTTIRKRPRPTYKRQMAKWKKQAAGGQGGRQARARQPRLRAIRARQHRPGQPVQRHARADHALRHPRRHLVPGRDQRRPRLPVSRAVPRDDQNWRDDWQQGDFPFYFVQLANFMARSPSPDDSDWAELREAQTMTLKLPNTGQAVIIDIGDANEHPSRRTSRTSASGWPCGPWPRPTARNVVYSGPMYRSMAKQGEQDRRQLRPRRRRTGGQGRRAAQGLRHRRGRQEVRVGRRPDRRRHGRGLQPEGEGARGGALRLGRQPRVQPVQQGRVCPPARSAPTPGRA